MVKKSWTTTKLIVLGSITTLDLLIWLPIESLFGGSGNPLVFITTAFTSCFFDIFTLLIINEFGAVTLKTFLLVILKLPFPRILPSTFLFLYVLIGFILDTLFYVFKKNEKIASIVIGGVKNILTATTMYLVLRLIGLPVQERIPTVILNPFGIIITFSSVFILGALAGYFAFLVYNKIKNTSIVKRIQR
jgi:hypothetical protein